MRQIPSAETMWAGVIRILLCVGCARVQCAEYEQLLEFRTPKYNSSVYYYVDPTNSLIADTDFVRFEVFAQTFHLVGTGWCDTEP